MPEADRKVRSASGVLETPGLGTDGDVCPPGSPKTPPNQAGEGQTSDFSRGQTSSFEKNPTQH
jgi:hypothetical protein